MNIPQHFSCVVTLPCKT